LAFTQGSTRYFVQRFERVYHDSRLKHANSSCEFLLLVTLDSQSRTVDWAKNPYAIADSTGSTSGFPELVQHGDVCQNAVTKIAKIKVRDSRMVVLSRERGTARWQTKRFSGVTTSSKASW